MLLDFLRSKWALVAVIPIGAVTALAVGPDETTFLSQNNLAMITMTDAMAIESTSDLDRDLVAMMAPHRQGAIDMAMAERRHGRIEELKELVPEIIVGQRRDITAMLRIIGETELPPTASPTPPGRSLVPMTAPPQRSGRSGPTARIAAP